MKNERSCVMRIRVQGAALCVSFCAGFATAQPVDNSVASRSGDARVDAAAPADERIETLVVTGTRLREQSAQEVRIYDRSRIEHSGQTTVADFLATVPEVSLNSLESTYGATTVRLRGATEGSTLVLINGRRTQAVTGSAALVGFFDLNTIPLSMVERIDVLPDGSSAIYGGEALAGVVNIVLRSDFRGAEASLGYKSAQGTDEKNVYGGAGWKSDSASLSFMVSYSDRSALSGSERDITANSDMRRFGGPNLALPFCGSPADIYSAAGNLPGLNSSLAAVPRASSGVGLQPSDFAATAGTQNYGSYNAYQDLLLDSTRTGFFLSAEYRLRGGIELFTELLASEYKNEGATTPPFFLQSAVPATNAFNPFGTTVLAAGVVRGAEQLATFTFHDDLLRPLVGARGRLGEWDWELTALHSQDKGGWNIGGQPNGAALSAALASSDPRTALNPFVDGPMASPDVLASIFGQSNVTHWEGDSTLLNGFVRGAPLRLPAGRLETVLGGEYEQSGPERNMDADRSAKAAFTELRAPVIARGNELGAMREVLALKVAARYDNYSDFGARTTWQAGIELRPTESVLLRATSGTAFKPPTLYNLAAPSSSAAFPVVDPRRNGESVVVQAEQGGNPDLNPTTSRSSALGVVWSPTGMSGLVASLTGWSLRIDSGIKLPNPQYIVANESLYPGRVVRAASSPGSVGQIISVDATYINFGSIREEGIDAGVDWNVRSKAGRFSPAIAATYMTQFEGASAPGGANVDRLSRASSDGIFAPRLKATAGAGWSPNDVLKISLAGRYVGRYYDYTPTRMLGDVWFIDGAVEIALGKMPSSGGGPPGGLKLFITGTNLADKLPPYATHFRGYDIYNYDLIGRTMFVRLQGQF